MCVFAQSQNSYKKEDSDNIRENIQSPHTISTYGTVRLWQSLFLREKMRKIKNIVIIIMLILGFSFQCEVFHQEIWNFDTGHYLSSVIHFESEEERKQLINDLYKVANENDVDVFAVKIMVSNLLQNELNIYGDESIKNTIFEINGIQEKNYNSVFSGEVKVIYHEFIELENIDNRYINTVSYIGEEENIYKVYKSLQGRYKLSVPEIVNSTEKDMIYTIWSIIALLMVVMTCIEIIYGKKEKVIRISMGESVFSIIVKCVLVEILTDIFLFAIVKTIVFHFISGEFMSDIIYYIYCIGMVVSCCCYCSYGFYDIKMAFSNINDSKTILNITYFVKFLVTGFSIVIIVTNLTVMMDDITIINGLDIVNNYKGYSYLKIRDLNQQQGNDEYDREEFYGELYEKIYLDYYDEAMPAINVMALQDDDKKLNYIYVNEYAGSLLGDFVKDLQYSGDADVVYFIPEKWDCEETRIDAKDCLSSMIKDINQLDIQVVPYKKDRTFTYIDVDATLGMKSVRNPVVIYSKYSGVKNKNNLCLYDQQSNVMFKLSNEDKKRIVESYNLEEEGYEISLTGIAEYYEYRNNILRKGIAYCSSICCFTVILQFMLLIILNRMEYRKNAMELALKKVLGYSIWAKNGKLILSSLFFNGIVIMILIMIGKTMNLYATGICVAIGLFITTIELIIIVVHITIFERKNIQKILKGGCL